MNTRIINQGDPRWSSLPYPKNPWTVKSDGCGLCAVTMCAMELSQYWNYTPKDTIGFMRQYATNGNGTEWAGIDAGLEKYIGNYKRHYNMSSFWDEVSKGNRVGAILFGSNTAPDGTVWTRGGHYVCFVDYKYENGQHWLYTKDSSYRHNDGWHSYERSMRGCIPDVLWTAEVKDMKNGWFYENGWRFYKNGVMLENGWAQDSKGKWFYLDANGKMTASHWVEWRGDWYYLKADGEMATNEWINYSKGTHYVGADGKMWRNKWVKDGAYYYFVDENGDMIKGKTATVPCTFDVKGRWYVK